MVGMVIPRRRTPLNCFGKTCLVVGIHGERGLWVVCVITKEKLTYPTPLFDSRGGYWVDRIGNNVEKVRVGRIQLAGSDPLHFNQST